MKNKTKISIGLSILSMAVILFALGGVDKNSTVRAETNTCTSWTLVGTVSTNGNPTEAWFNWGISSSSLSFSTPHQTFNSDSSFSQVLSPLEAGRTYYWRAMAQNSNGNASGEIKNFTTPSCAPQNVPLTLNISADQSNVSFNGSTTIRWSSNGTSCNATGGSNGWSGQGYSGNSTNNNTSFTFPTGTLTNATTYTITCTNGTDTRSAATTVTVGNAPAQTCQDTSARNYGGSLPCTYNAQTCQDTSANNYGGALPCTYTSQVCQDPSAINYRGSLPCRYQAQTCQDPSAINYGGAIPCRYQTQTCQDTSANNYGGALPCTYTSQLCQDPSAINYRGTLPCRYQAQTCQDPSASNYGGAIPCRYTVQTCQDTSASNYGGALPCRYTSNICQDPSAINYHGSLPCRYQNIRPTVSIEADDTSIDFDDSTRIRWESDDADSCRASGGSNGWSGSRSEDGSFGTGSLTSDKTYTITCTNDSSGLSASDSVTVRVDDENNNANRPTVDISADDTSISWGESTRVRWESDDADDCDPSGGANGWSGRNISEDGTFSTGSLTRTTTFSIRCTNDEGSDTDSVTINVGNAPGGGGTNFIAPTVTLYADSNSLSYGSATNVRWITNNATTCFGSGGSLGWAGEKNVGTGSFYTGSLTSSRTFTLTCSNSFTSATDSTTISVRSAPSPTPTPRPTPAPTPRNAIVIIDSSLNSQPLQIALDNTRPEPGDEITLTVHYKNIGNASVTNLNLRISLPYEVDYLSSTPSNPTFFGNTLLFNLGTLRANDEGTVTVRTRVRDTIAPGTTLNFPATLDYIDPSGFPQSVSANVSAQVWKNPDNLQPQVEYIPPAPTTILGANVFGAGFLPSSFLGWLLLLILILVLLLLAKHVISPMRDTKPIVIER